MSDALQQHLDDLRQLTEPDEALLARLRAGRAPRARPPWRLLPLAAAALAAWFLATPEVPQPVDSSWSAGVAEAELGPHVHARVEGHGQVRGDAQDMVLDWTAGLVELEVSPGQGVKLEVNTEEAQVRVTGTRFLVRRDARGTVVEVRRGHVAVRCGEAPEQALGAGGRLLCPPVTAAGWLRRVIQLSGQPEDVLAGVEAGLALSPAPEVEVELRLRRAAVWLRAGERDRAEAELAALERRFPAQAARVAAAREQLLPR